MFKMKVYSGWTQNCAGESLQPNLGRSVYLAIISFNIGNIHRLYVILYRIGIFIRIRSNTGKLTNLMEGCSWNNERICREGCDSHITWVSCVKENDEGGITLLHL